jgi:lysophospholipase L1-like esterase
MNLGCIINWECRLKKAIFMIGVVFLMAIIFLSKSAYAESATYSWSGTGNNPTVFSTNSLSDIGPSLCSSPYQLKNIEGEMSPKRVCLTTSETVNFGAIYFDSSANFTWVVSFGYDSKMYKFRSPCDRYDSCLYLPDSDTLVVKQYFGNGYPRSLVVYKNFRHRVSKTYNGFIMEYNLDSSNPDYTFSNAEGNPWPIGAFGASDDGKWVAVEFIQRGIELLDLQTLEMKRVTTAAYNYGVGMNPYSEIAVSNGGKQVAVMGLNSGLSVYDVNPDCGDEATDNRLTNGLLITRPCQTMYIDTNNFINRFFYGANPKFNNDGGQLSFYALSYVDQTREVILRANGYGGKKMNYLALGDSFTSGEGETDNNYYLSGTNNNYEKCHVSTRSYPYLVSSMSSLDMTSMKNVACSGATTNDVIGDEILYFGQNGRLGADKLDLNDADKTLSKNEAKLSFIPGRIHQEIFVSEYQPKVITIGIGGNDVGFIDKLNACIGIDICSWASSAEDKEQTAIEIKNLYDKLVQTYQKIHTNSPTSKILAVGYPLVVDDIGYCSLLLGNLLDSTERRFMNEGVMYINQVIESASREVGIGYVGVQNSFGNQALCGSTKPSALNGIKIGDDISLFDNLDWAKVIGQESFHPNSVGHSLVANSIFNFVGNISDFEYCVNGAIVCPNRTSAPEPSTYWIPDVLHNYPTQQIANFVSDSDDSIDNRHKQIDLGENSLAPNSSVNIEVTSDTVSLGQFTATNKGALLANIELPVDIEEGYHTIHLYGVSFSGESIELYQVILHKKPTVIKQESKIDVIDNSSQVTITPTTNLISANDKKEITIPSAGNINDVTVLPANTDSQIAATTPIQTDYDVKGASIELVKPSSLLAVKSNDFFNLPLIIASVFGLLVVIVVGLLGIRLVRKIRA